MYTSCIVHASKLSPAYLEQSKPNCPLQRKRRPTTTRPPLEPPPECRNLALQQVSKTCRNFMFPLPLFPPPPPRPARFCADSRQSSPSENRLYSGWIFSFLLRLLSRSVGATLKNL